MALTAREKLKRATEKLAPKPSAVAPAQTPTAPSTREFDPRSVQGQAAPTPTPAAVPTPAPAPVPTPTPETPVIIPPEAEDTNSSLASNKQLQFMISLGLEAPEGLTKIEATRLLTIAIAEADAEKGQDQPTPQPVAPTTEGAVVLTPKEYLSEPRTKTVRKNLLEKYGYPIYSPTGSGNQYHLTDEEYNEIREAESSESSESSKNDTKESIEPENPQETTIGDIIVRFGDTLSIVESLANFGLKTVLAKEILIAPFKIYERQQEAQVDTKAFARTTLGKVLGLAGLATEAVGIAAIGNIGNFSGTAITQTLSAKPVLWGAGSLISTSGIMAWLASDNILSGGDIFIRDLKWNVASEAVSPADARIILDQIDEWRDLATTYVNAATILNPFMWPFRNLLLANAQKSELKIAVARQEIEKEIEKLNL